MNEVKPPKKPLVFYYGIVMLILFLFNFLAMPWFMQRQIKEVDYGTFMSMTESKEIGRVEIQDNQIAFTDKEETQIYKTGIMYDPGLVERLYDSGAQFTSEIVQEMSPFLSIILNWILPVLIFVGIGQLLTRKLIDRAGGGGSSMMFNMGKSSAKVYVNLAAADVAKHTTFIATVKPADMPLYNA